MRRSRSRKGLRVTDRALGGALIALARNAIGARFGHAAADVPRDPALDRPGATFVTLMQEGDLRGCIGSLEATRALSTDVSANAVAAAFRDPRFPSLAAHEFPLTSVEVSLLSPQEVLAVADEDDLERTLRAGVDGLVLQYGRHRATFLPQVWDTLPEPRQFVAALKNKAGLREDFWSRELHLARYTVTKWKERELAAEVERR
jgi:AmmeMemoRadiSam system protein A